MHFGATELAIVGDLTSGGFYQRRTAERCHAVFLDATWLVSTTDLDGDTSASLAVANP